MKQAEILAIKFQFVGVDITADELADQIETQANEYRISEETAVPLIEDQIIKSYGLNLQTYENATTADLPYEYIEDLYTPEEFVQVVAVVDDLWEEYDERVQQMGTLADGTGKIKFTVWNIANQPLLEERAVYSFRNVVVKEHNGKLEIKITKKSVVEKLINKDAGNLTHTADGENETIFEGVITRIEPGSGLIERCSADSCTHVLKNGHCSEHGNVDGVDDIRVKAIVDNGTNYKHITLSTDACEGLLEFTVEDALSHPDIDVDEEIRSCFTAKHVKCSLTEYENNCHVRKFEFGPMPSADDIIELRDTADQLQYVL